jgi:hypothetical protein
MELHMMREEIEDLLEQDGDPEMFEMFLKVCVPFALLRDRFEPATCVCVCISPTLHLPIFQVHFQFRVRDAERFKLTTVNLDHSIRRELARIRGTTGLKNSGWGRNLAPLNIRTVINMTSEDVCKAVGGWLCPTWHPIPYLVHSIRPGSIATFRSQINTLMIFLNLYLTRQVSY